MKKSISIFFALGLIALASCQKEQIVNLVFNDSPIYTIPFNVTVGDDTKAFYDSKNDSGVFPLVWEENDQIMALKGITSTPSSNGTNTDEGSILALVNEKGATADFAGEVATKMPDASAIWYYMYPADKAEMSTSVTKSGIIGGTITRSTTLSITLPETQDGRWIPYAYANSDAAYVGTEPQSIRFGLFTSCIAVRVYEHDGLTPKKAGRITLQTDDASSYLTGVYTCTLTENTQPTQSADVESFTFNGEGQVIVAEVADVEAREGGVYEYRINVPAKLALGSISMTVSDGEKEINRTIPAMNGGYVAGRKYNYSVVWDEDVFDDTVVTFDITSEPKTSYSYYKALNGVAVKDLEKANAMKGLEVEDGQFSAVVSSTVLSSIDEYGYYVGNKKYVVSSTATTDMTFASALSVDDFDEAGQYELDVYAYVAVGNKVYKSESKKITLVASGLPYEISFITNNTRDLVEAAGWTVSGTEGVGSQSSQFYLSQNGKHGYMTSPAYFCPENTAVHVDFLQKLYGVGGRKVAVYIDVVNARTMEAKTKRGDCSASTNTSPDGGRTTTSADLSISGKQYVSLSNDGNTSNSWLPPYVYYYYIHNYKIIYK